MKIYSLNVKHSLRSKQNVFQPITILKLNDPGELWTRVTGGSSQ